MANILRISGIPIPILTEAASHTTTQIGENERAEDGSMIISRRALKENYKLKIAHQIPTDAIAYRELFLGRGHTWNFDTTVYSSKGLGPTVLTNTVINATSKYGAGGAQQTASSGRFRAIALPANGTKWTVMLWRKIGAGAFVHYIVTNTTKGASQAYVNGVLASDTTVWLGVSTSTGTVTLDADGASTTNIDDLVILPYEIPASWPANIFAYGAAFSQLAYLDVDGDLIDANLVTKSCKGGVSGISVQPGWLNGVYYQSIRVVDAELEEV